MKHKTSNTLAVATFLALALTSHAQLSLNFSSSPGGPGGGSTIQFNGTNSSFQFNAATTPYSIPNPPSAPIVVNYYVGSQWTITSVIGGAGGTNSAQNLLGVVNNGPFSYGPITVSNNVQSAYVIGPLGGLVINDNVGNFLTGTVDWIQVATYDFGGYLGINAALNVNVTDLTYTGSNLDLLALAATELGGMNLSFQFSPGMTLSDLSTGSGPFLTSYSGSIAPVPEPATLALAGLGGLCVLLLRRRK